MGNLDGKRAFLQVYELKSFSKAANYLSISVAKVSKLISELESDLSTRLFDRTTRIVIPTAAAHKYAPELSELLIRLEQLDDSVSAGNKKISGTLKISIPMDYGRRVIAPLLADFLKEHQDIRLVVEYSDENIDLYDSKFDLAIRAGDLVDSNLYARKLDSFGMIAGASDEYLSKKGCPQSLEELSDFETLGYSLSGKRWKFMDINKKDYLVNVRSRLTSNNGEAVVTAAIAGVGIAYQPDFLMKDPISKGQLEPILAAYCHRRIGVYAVFLAKDYLPLRTRAFIDYLELKLSME